MGRGSNKGRWVFRPKEGRIQEHCPLHLSVHRKGAVHVSGLWGAPHFLQAGLAGPVSPRGPRSHCVFLGLPFKAQS